MSGTDPDDRRHHVVIIGCGFGGLFAVRALKRAPVRITLIDRTNHHLFQPLLYQVATGILSEGQIAPAIRDVLRNYPSLRVILGEVEQVDVEAREVHVDEFGKALTIPYDSLIVAGGATSSYFGHDEFREFSFSMKSLDDALALRGQIFGAFELAEAEPDPEERRRLMTFVVIGGGPTGVEMAGQLRELSRRALRRNYRMIDPVETRVVLVEGVDRLVGSMGSYLARMTKRDLTRMGVEIHLDTMVTNMDETGVEITKQDSSTEWIPAATKVWAAGTRAAGLGSTVAGAAGAETDKAGRVVVNPDCSIPTHPEVYRRGRPDGAPRRSARRGRGGDAIRRPRRPLDRAPPGRQTDQAVPLSRPWDPGRDLSIHCGGQDRPAPGRRIRRMAAVARRARHLPHRIQEPVRRADPLAGQFRRPGSL